ncbi:MAG: hypothetical protein NZ533_07170 [Casimicrobiaceae bacterium]|nr:hypothetical protein [Casimicrobiaceae bacterium]MCX8097696.1 hypothetical protein [Casimicrobiaceae bacterium]MDW8312289.1 hypothetical protein [Burkholderiales bacterium]
MNLLNLVLAVLAAALAAALGWLTDWGQALQRSPEVRPGNVPRSELAGVLPDFRISGDASAYAAVVERPLLNPTRRPAPSAPPPPPPPEPPKPQIRRGLYQLVGVTDLGGTRIAQVKEIATNTTRSVRVGDMLQELKVEAITADSVRLAFAGETDVITLPKFTASARVPQPPPPPPPPAPPPQPAPAPGGAPPASAPGSSPVPGAPQPQASATSPAAGAGGSPSPPQVPSGEPLPGSAAHEARVRELEARAAQNPTNWNRMRAEMARREYERALNEQQNRR